MRPFDKLRVTEEKCSRIQGFEGSNERAKVQKAEVKRTEA